MEQETRREASQLIATRKKGATRRMKRIARVIGVVCALSLAGGIARAQDEAAPSPAVTTTSQSAQQQIGELHARLQQLEAQLQQTQQSQEETAKGLEETQKAQKKLAAGERVKFSGYVQSQFTSDEAASPETDFRVRRARLKIEAPVTDLAGLTLQIDATKKVELKDAYVDLGRKQDLWRFRMGQSKIPFMYEVLESSSRRLSPERTALARTLFDGERDIGAWVHFKNALGDGVPGTTLDIGAMSGNGPNASDNNNTKDLVARLRFPISRKPVDKNTEADSIYLGYLTGELTDGEGLTTDKHLFGGGISRTWGPVWLRGEAIWGENLGKDISGWYARLAYQLERAPGTLFVRYERFDEDRDTPNTDYKNVTVGYEHKLDDKTRVILAHDLRDPDPGHSDFSKTDGGLTTLRVQVKY